MSATLFRVVLPVADLDRAAAFYGALLDHDGGRRVSPNRHYLDCGPVILGLVIPDGGPGSARPNREPVYLAVDDLDAAHARAASLGCLFDGEYLGAPGGAAVTRAWGERSFYAVDPFGNPLCFVAAGTEFTGRG